MNLIGAISRVLAAFFTFPFRSSLSQRRLHDGCNESVDFFFVCSSVRLRCATNQSTISRNRAQHLQIMSSSTQRSYVENAQQRQQQHQPHDCVLPNMYMDWRAATDESHRCRCTLCGMGASMCETAGQTI